MSTELRSSVPTLHPRPGVVPLGRIETHDLDVLRLVLRGSSVVDWYRMHFRSREEICAFIRVNGMDPDDPIDRARLSELQAHAEEILREHMGYRRIPEVIKSATIEELFEYASGKGRRAYRFYACITLKMMHVVHYTDAHELLSMLPISNAELVLLVRGRVERAVRGLIERGFPIVEFHGNAKTKHSVWTKLLAKKDTQAAQVFDKLRFRFVLKRLEDVPSLIIALTRELFPFNYVVPNQSDNSLIDLDHVLRRAGNQRVIEGLTADKEQVNEASRSMLSSPKNEFSGPGYKVVHFVTEVPLRIDRVLPFRGPRLMGLGTVAFGTVEFQVMDERSARTNEQGENRHALYKARQLVRVKERLERGKREKNGHAHQQPAKGDT